MNLFKKVVKPYPFGKDVPFEVAFKALKEGYMIKHANCHDAYLIMINGRIIEMLDRDGGETFEVKEFDTFTMLMDRWEVLEPLTNANRKEIKNKKEQLVYKGGI